MLECNAGQLWRHGDVGVHQLGCEAPNQESPPTVRIHAVLRVNRRSTSQPPRRSAIDERVWVVRMHDVDAVLPKVRREPEWQGEIDSGPLGNRGGHSALGTERGSDWTFW